MRVLLARGGTYTSRRKGLDLLCELWGLDDDSLMGRVCGFGVTAADDHLDNGALHQTGVVSTSSRLRGAIAVQRCCKPPKRVVSCNRGLLNRLRATLL